MIVLHDPGIIFLKSRKTAGSSLEIALSAFAQSGDVITPIDPKEGDDQVREKLGYPGPMNYEKSTAEVFVRPTIRDLRYALRGKEVVRYHHHCSASRARLHLGKKRWEQMTKVSIVRNPWDYMVSSYYWGNRDQGELPAFQSWCLEKKRLMNRNHRQYFIGNRCVIDRFIRYENFREDLLSLEEEFSGLSGLADNFSGMTAKKGIRPKSGPSVAELFSKAPKADRLVRRKCQFEIDTFGYEGPVLEKV
ncbi:hypothetical protein [Spiribacter vilamensis]|uniref:Sulfotransferase family protein n=1 Tax=Spiribacter vilamensis TaxID=531306 RepID=A0A4Q8D1X8_9GAMM|nr:hypothetical protein [Spiribacter vilamensis]RZU99411.1 hypothetical protein EV698_1701 [Spiribacter vilamensis]TVO61614.1 hypothetical protein FPL09_05725 [Spiribacter vilamensis]